MRREKMRPRRRREDAEKRPRPRRLFVTLLPAIAFAAVTLVGGGTVAAVKYTGQPRFCATCHEMTPYHAAWQAGPHKNVSCVSCHVDPGVVPEYTHKVVALKEVYDHLASDPKFPNNDADVPSARCIACHEKIPDVTKSGFPHSRHARQGPCVSCHADTGHKVTLEALSAAKLLSKDARSAPASAKTTGTHVNVSCTKCHDIVTTACETCHSAPHVARGTCVTCHTAGAKWSFAHPQPGADCATCHERPKAHFQGTCGQCHTPQVKFARTVYKHTSTECETCHTQKSGHPATKSRSCSICHARPGRDWGFTHPAQTAACTTCHSAPANHFSGKCASCHNPGTPFARTKFSHPSSTSCASCHSKPSGHRSTSAGCFTCHKRPGRSWAFSHPGSKSCASCHRPPSNHFGTDCSGCHTPSKPFSSSSFRHPSSGAPHGISGKACTSCHPGGDYQRVGCSCHGGGVPSDD